MRKSLTLLKHSKCIENIGSLPLLPTPLLIGTQFEMTLKACNSGFTRLYELRMKIATKCNVLSPHTQMQVPPSTSVLQVLWLSSAPCLRDVLIDTLFPPLLQLHHPCFQVQGILSCLFSSQDVGHLLGASSLHHPRSLIFMSCSSSHQASPFTSGDYILLCRLKRKSCCIARPETAPSVKQFFIYCCFPPTSEDIDLRPGGLRISFFFLSLLLHSSLTIFVGICFSPQDDYFFQKILGSSHWQIVGEEVYQNVKPAQMYLNPWVYTVQALKIPLYSIEYTSRAKMDLKDKFS